MTQRTITSPYDPETLAEIQARIAAHLNVSSWSAGLSSAHQTSFQRIIDASADYLVRRYGHEPWMLHELSVSLAANTATAEIDYLVRQLVLINETYSSTTRVATPTTKREYMLAWGSGATTHPWNTQTEPRWYYDGMSADNPPKQRWTRVPTPDKAVTAAFLVRPYMTLLSTSGDQTYTHIPAEHAEQLFHWILYKVSLENKSYDEAQIQKAAMEDEMQATLVNSAPEGAVETAREVGVPDFIWREMEP